MFFVFPFLLVCLTFFNACYIIIYCVCVFVCLCVCVFVCTVLSLPIYTQVQVTNELYNFAKLYIFLRNLISFFFFILSYHYFYLFFFSLSYQLIWDFIYVLLSLLWIFLLEYWTHENDKRVCVCVCCVNFSTNI